MLNLTVTSIESAGIFVDLMRNNPSLNDVTFGEEKVHSSRTTEDDAVNLVVGIWKVFGRCRKLDLLMRANEGWTFTGDV